jgi:alpha-L-fucosidase
MRYVVLTSRHHDGYSLWPTRHSDFHAPTDIVGAFVEACRAEGLRVGLYYSLSDWHHPDYPAMTDADRPYTFSPRRSSPEAWERYRAYLAGQLTELLTDYGTIDLLWFDGGWERSAAEWDTNGLRALIASLQPDCIVNDRLPGHGEFETPEQFVPASPPPGPWETCLTMNSTWGWCPADTGYKSSRSLVHTICEVAGRGGNLLLNVSPKGDGSHPEEQLTRLADVSPWMERYGSSIVGTTPGLEPWQWYGPSTRAADGDVWFAHLLARPYDTVTVRGVPIKRVASVVELASGRSLSFDTRTTVIDSQFHPDPNGEVIVEVPEDVVDVLATVLAVTITPKAP